MIYKNGSAEGLPLELIARDFVDWRVNFTLTKLSGGL